MVVTAKRASGRLFSRLGLAFGLALWVGLGTFAAGGESGLAWTSAGEAFRATRETGRPTVLLVSSSEVPHCRQFRSELFAAPAVGRLAGAVEFAELIREAAPEQVKRLGIETYPTVIIYERDGMRLRIRDYMAGPRDPGQVGAWLFARIAEPAAGDRSIERASHGGGEARAIPSAQGASMPLPSAPPPAVAAPAPSPAYAAQAQAVVAPPQPTYVIQQPAPNLVFVPTGTPTVSYAQPVVAGAAPQALVSPNLFMQPAGAPVAAPAPAPSGQSVAGASPAQGYATSPFVMVSPYAAAPQYGAPLVYAQAPGYAAPAGSPIGAAVTAYVLTHPGVVKQALGALGHALAQCAQPKLKPATAPLALVGSAPMGYVPTVYAAAPGYAAPVGAASWPVAAPAPAPAPYTATPQSEPPRHGWFHRR
jgi:hypothetical protein